MPCHCSLTLHFQGEVETHDLSTYAAPAILSYYTIYEASSSCLHEEILPINLHSLLLFHVTFPYTQERSFSSSRLYLQCFQIHHWCFSHSALYQYSFLVYWGSLLNCYIILNCILDYWCSAQGFFIFSLLYSIWLWYSFILFNLLWFDLHLFYNGTACKCKVDSAQIHWWKKHSGLILERWDLQLIVLLSKGSKLKFVGCNFRKSTLLLTNISSVYRSLCISMNPDLEHDLGVRRMQGHCSSCSSVT